MTTDEELRRLAQAATPGKWLQRGGASVVTVLQGNTFKILAVVGAPQMAQGLEYAGRTANAAFIAAADPSRILQLLDERDALRERVGALENEVDTLRYLDDEAQIGVDAQTAELRQAQAEVKRLTAELAASQAREQTATAAYARQQEAQRQAEALYNQAIEDRDKARRERDILIDRTAAFTAAAGQQSADVAQLWREREQALASVALLIDAVVRLAPGATVEGLQPEVQAAAEGLLQRLADLTGEIDLMRSAHDAYRKQITTLSDQVNEINVEREKFRDMTRGDRAIQYYYRARLRNKKVTLKDVAQRYGMSHGAVRKHKQRYDAAGKWGSKRSANDDKETDHG